MNTIAVADIAHARSGDKGNRANIGVVAFDGPAYLWLKEYLTGQVVHEYFQSIGIGTVVRYELPNIHAFNFVMDEALAGGASRSLRLDTQGKALASALLELRLPAPTHDKEAS